MSDPAARRSTAAILAIPAALAIATVAGLTSGLLGDGGFDVAAAIGIGASLAAIGWGLLHSRTP